MKYLNIHDLIKMADLEYSDKLDLIVRFLTEISFDEKDNDWQYLAKQVLLLRCKKRSQ